MHHKLLLATALVAGATVSVVAPAAGVVSAAPVDLTERQGTPFTAPFGGWFQDFAVGQMFSSAAVADVTGDGQPEIVVGSMNSQAHVWELVNGHHFTLDPGGADPNTGHGATQAAPAIGDLNGDGIDDVLIANTGGRLAAFSLAGGSVAPIYNHFVAPEFAGAIEGVFGTPALGYVDADVQLDAVVSSWGQTVDLYSGPSGARDPNFHFWSRDTIWSSPVIGDIDGSGRNSIVVGGDCDGSGTPQPCYGTNGGGYVWAFDLEGNMKWEHWVDRAVVWSTPALIDLTGDGALDVVVGTGNYPYRGQTTQSHKVMALNGKTGQLLWEAATGGPTTNSPSVAVVNGQPRVFSISAGGHLYSWDRNGAPLWQQCITDGGCSAGAGTFGGVAIADVNDDGTLDAVVQAEQQIKVFNAVTGAPEQSRRSSYGRTLFASNATPTVAEVNGRAAIVMVNIGDANNDLRQSGADELVVTVWQTGTGLGDAPWPTFKRNMARTGGPLPVPPDPRTLPQIVRPNERMCVATVGAQPGDFVGLNITPIGATAPGFGSVHSSDDQPGATSNVNYGPGTVDPNVAFVEVGADGKVCYTSSEHASVHVIIDEMIVADGGAFRAPANGGAQRLMDTRAGIGGGKLAPGEQRCVAVVGATPGEFVGINALAVEADSAGFGTVHASGSPPGESSTVNFLTASIDPNFAFSQVGPDGKICFTNSPHSAVHVVLDELIVGDSDALARPAGPTGTVRTVDTRISVPSGRLLQNWSVCFAIPGGQPGDFGGVNILAVGASGAGFGTLHPSGSSPGATSNVNFRPGSFDPNFGIARIGADGKLCVTNSEHSTVDMIVDAQLVADAGAFSAPTQQGSSRLVDTRSGRP